MFFGVRWFNALIVTFRCGNNVFHSLSKSYFPPMWSFLLAWLSHVELLKVNLAFFVSWILLQKPQAAIPSSFNINWSTANLAPFAYRTFATRWPRYKNLLRPGGSRICNFIPLIWTIPKLLSANTFLREIYEKILECFGLKLRHYDFINFSLNSQWRHTCNLLIKLNSQAAWPGLQLPFRNILPYDAQTLWLLFYPYSSKD